MAYASARSSSLLHEHGGVSYGDMFVGKNAVGLLHEYGGYTNSSFDLNGLFVFFHRTADEYCYQSISVQAGLKLVSESR